jgi:hypothetical protein
MFRVLASVSRSNDHERHVTNTANMPLALGDKSPFTTEAPKLQLHNAGRLFADAKYFHLCISVSVRLEVQFAHGLYGRRATDIP